MRQAHSLFWLVVLVVDRWAGFCAEIDVFSDTPALARSLQ